jgi:hypothetical protein
MGGETSSVGKIDYYYNATQKRKTQVTFTQKEDTKYTTDNNCAQRRTAFGLSKNDGYPDSQAWFGIQPAQETRLARKATSTDKTK